MRNPAQMKIHRDIVTGRMLAEHNRIKEEERIKEQSELLWIGWNTLKTLRENGIKTKAKLLALTEEEIKAMFNNPISIRVVQNFINKEKLWHWEQ